MVTPMTEAEYRRRCTGPKALRGGECITRKPMLAKDIELKDDRDEIIYTPPATDEHGERVREGWANLGANAGYYGVYDPRPNVSSFCKLEDACQRYREIFNREPVASVVSRGDADAIESYELIAEEPAPVRIHVRESLPVNYFYVGQGESR